MSGVLLGVAAGALVAATGLASAALLRLRSVPELLLAAYLIAFAEVVALVLALSAIDALSRAGLVVGVLGLFGAALAGWLVAGKPLPPRLRPYEVRAVAGSGPVLALASTLALAFVYVGALGVATPPNSWDSLTYHLPRAAFWSQQGHVGYIASSYDGRLNGNPPNGELPFTFLFDVTGNERLVGLVQFVAALGCAVGVFALARRLAFSTCEAAFGALLFLTLPVVLLQAPTTQNDLVLASMLIAAAVFTVGTSTASPGLAALATALAVGTKVPVVFGLPLLVALALTAPGTSRRVARLLALTVGTAAGSYWYVVNIRNSGQLFGPLSGSSETVEGGLLRPPKEAFLSALGLAVDSFDLSGSRGADIFVYAIAAALVAGLVAVFSRGAAHRVRVAALTGALALLPLALYPGSYAAWRTFAKLYDILAEPGWFDVRLWDPTRSGEYKSWFGPVGLLLVLGVGVTAVVLVRRGSLPRRALVYASAPLLALVLVALVLAYNPWHGRLLVFPVALAAALWGVGLRSPPVAWAIVAVAASTTVLSLVNNQSKPSGLRLLEPDPPPSVWTMKRWEVESLQRDIQPALRYVEEQIPRSARVALAFGYDDFAYPVFGPTLARTVELVKPHSDGRDVLDADWLLAVAGRISTIDRACWRRVFDSADRGDRWVIFRRRPGSCLT